LFRGLDSGCRLQHRHDRSRRVRRTSGNGRALSVQHECFDGTSRAWARGHSTAHRTAAEGHSAVAVKRLILATTNAGKIIAIRSPRADLPSWSLEPLPSGTPPIEETGKTFVENATLKARHYSRLVDDLTLADDSGLCVDALGGRPGVHSARYAPDPPSRIERVLREMKSVPDGQRSAIFYCALALGRAGSIIWTVQKDVAGVIARSAAGACGVWV